MDNIDTQAQSYAENDVTVPVKFNKMHRDLSIEEAANFAQMGMKYQQILPVISKAKFIAARDNQTLAEFIDNVCQSRDAELKSQLSAKVGGDEELTELLIQQMNMQAQNEYDAMLKLESDENDHDNRLDDGFALISEHFPEYESADMLPDAVIKTAEQHNISLFDALLRYNFEQQRLCERETARQIAAAAASTGSQHSSCGENTSAEISALMRGIIGKK